MDTEVLWHKDTSALNVCGCLCVPVCEALTAITYTFKIILPQTLDN